MLRKSMILVLCLALASIAGCKNKQAERSSIIKIDGSSTVYPITEAIAELYRVNTSTKITIGVSGTGGGFKKFCAGLTDISDASRTIKPSEIALCKKNGIQYIKLPIAYDGISVVVNPANQFVDYLTVAELKRMWAPAAQEKITSWNQVRPSFPNQPLALLGPGTDSGTFDYFTQKIVGKSHASRGDYTASEDDNVLVHGVENNKNALGFFGFAYYEENMSKLRVIPIKNGDNAPAIAPSRPSIANGSYQPLSRAVFIYVNDKAMQRPEVNQFVNFYLAHASKVATQVGYIGLPDAKMRTIQHHYKTKLKSLQNRTHAN